MTEHSPEPVLGSGLLLGALAAWGAFDVAVAAASMGAATTLWLSVFSSIIFVTVAIVIKDKITFSNIKFLFPRAVLRVSGLCFTLGALSIFPVGVVTTITASSSLITLGVFARNRNEHVRLSTYFFVVLGLVGIFLVSRENSAEAIFTFNVALIIPICGAIISAYSALLWRDSAHVMHPIHNLAILHTWSAILCVPVIFVLSVIAPTKILPSNNIIALCSIIFFAGVGDWLFLRSQLHTSLTINAILGPCTPVFSSIFAIIFIDQHLGWMQWAGLLIVVASVSLATYTNQRKTGKISFETNFYSETVSFDEN